MVKLATARESRLYGHPCSRNRWEYINAGLYVFAIVLLIGGLAAQFSGAGDSGSGLVLLLTAFAIVIVVNLHDLAAHIAGIDCRWSLVGYDPQLALVEFAVPLLQALGSALLFLGICLILLQERKQRDLGFEKHALGLLIAGPVLWVIASVHDLCQFYERADGNIQILQKGVQIPFLMGSLLFLIGGIINRHDHKSSSSHRSLKLLRKSWVWLCIYGSLLLFMGGLANVLKVFKMQQMEGRGLEKLRGGAQEWVSRVRERRNPLIVDHRRVTAAAATTTTTHVEEPPRPAAPPTPYRDVLLS